MRARGEVYELERRGITSWELLLGQLALSHV